MVDMNLEILKETYKKSIAGYLAARCEKDTTLAEAVKKPGKTLDGVIAYVVSEAKKQAQNNVAIIPDEEVFNWAVHYILEDSLNFEPKKPEPAKPKQEKKQADTAPQQTAKKDKEQPQKAKTIADEIQLSLFDF